MASNPPYPPPRAAATGWRVTDQLETVGLDARGQATEGIKVYFVTRKGVTSSVFVPKMQYTPDNVKAAVAQAAGMLDEVHGLSG